jgi:predicted RND superfamily exporter protein
LSIVDYLKEADRVRHDRSVGRIPPERLYTVLLRMNRIAPDIFYQWSDESFSMGRVSARLPLSKADQLAAQVPLINAELDRRFPNDDLRLTSTGYVKLVNNMRIYLLKSQVKSLLLAALGVTIMMCWMLRSIRLGLLSMIPNLIPVAIGISVMGFTGILLDPGTVMIGSVALGLVVDDTCHFLAYLQRQQLAGENMSTAILTSMRRTGRPIVLTSIILSAGFMALAAGSFAPSIYFGVVISVIVIFALLADLLLLPAILQLLIGRRQSSSVAAAAATEAVV